MRITSGRFGGRQLIPPADDRIRPTSDKVRQAIFNVLRHNTFGRPAVLDNARVLDLFAGTGALGLEALSQGASYALFVEDDAESRAIIRRNVEALDLTGVTKIFRRDATTLGPMSAGAGGPFNLAFLDPPYRKGLVPIALASLHAGGWLMDAAILVVEVEKEFGPALPQGFSLLDDRHYGDTRILYMLANR